MNICLQCQKKHSKPKFCSRSCSAKFNNSKYPKRSLEIQNKCGTCGNKHTSGKDGYKDCARCRDKAYIELWLNGKERGGTDRKLKTCVRKYVLEAHNYSCIKCGFNEVHPDDGAPIVEIDHINGDGTDNRFENLTVLCPNHHAMTSTYRARNKGHGRPTYYTRVSIPPTV